MIGDAITRQKITMIAADEAIYHEAGACHVVGLDGAGIVCHCEIVDPFLVDRRGLWGERVAERIAGGGLFLFGIEATFGVGVSADANGQSLLTGSGDIIGSVQNE